MNRKLLFILLSLLPTVFSATAQISHVVKTVARTPKTVVSVSRGANSNIRYAVQARTAVQASQQTRGTARSEYRSWRGAVIPNTGNHSLDSMRRKREHSHLRRHEAPQIRFKKIPDFYSPMKAISERMNIAYTTAKRQIAQGVFDKYPMNLFFWANYAKSNGEDDVAAEILAHVDPATLTPGILYQFSNNFPAIQEYGPEFADLLTVTAYNIMIKAKYAGEDCGSARMQAGDTLMTVTGKYIPYLMPLAELSCFYDPSKETNRYKVAADSLLANYGLLTPQFKDAFFSDLLYTLHTSGEYQTALDYFEHEPLKNYPDSIASFNLNLASCSWDLNDNERFTHYIGQALAIDSVATLEYLNNIYDNVFDHFIANPTQTEAADWLIEYADYPAETALDATVAIINHYFPDNNDNDTWEWPKYTPEQLTACNGIIYILTNVAKLDTSNAQPATLAYIDYFKAVLISTVNNRNDEATDIINHRHRALTKNPSIETNDSRCFLVFAHAFIAGHGLDKPKEALKILKKNIKMLNAPEVCDDTRTNWYEYMEALSIRLGKTKDASKYLKLKEFFYNKAEQH